MNFSVKPSLASLCLALLLCGCAHPPTPSSNSGERFFTVSFPELKLATNEYIQQVSLEVQCGKIVAINAVPYDWSMDLAWDNPDLIKFEAQAGHFGAGFQNVHGLDRLLTISTEKISDLEIRAVLTTTTADPIENKDREYPFTITHLVLRPLPARALLSVNPADGAPVAWKPKVIPPPPPRVPNANGEIVVLLGDSVNSLAKKFNLTAPELLALNPGLDAAKLKIGQMIRVVR